MNIYKLKETEWFNKNGTQLIFENIQFCDIIYNTILNKQYKIHFIDIFLNNTPILFQLQSKIKEYDNNILSVELCSDTIINFVDKIENLIKDTVYKNSMKWFNKKFTKEKIESSFTSPLINNLLNINISKSSIFFNKYKTIIYPIQSEPFQANPCFDVPLTNIKEMDCIILIKLSNLQFVDNKFSYNLILEQCKVLTENIILNQCIILSE